VHSGLASLICSCLFRSKVAGSSLSFKKKKKKKALQIWLEWGAAFSSAVVEKEII
jgi:hypothetical protein